MGALIRSGARVAFDGDSNTAAGSLNWPHPGLSTTFDPTNVELSVGFVKSVNSVLQQARAPRAATNAGRRATNAGRASGMPVSVGSPIVEINTAINGQKVADIDVNFVAQISSQNPDAVVLFIGLNDATNPPTVGLQASIDSLSAKLVALGKPVLWLSIAENGSQWSAGPVWGNGQADVDIATVNAMIQAACTANGFRFVDLRTPLLADNAARNLPAPGSQTFHTYDRLHLRPLAQVIVGDAVLAQCTVIP